MCKRLQLLKGFWLLQLSEIESHPMALSKGQTRSHVHFYRLILRADGVASSDPPGAEYILGEAAFANVLSVG